MASELPFAARTEIARELFATVDVLAARYGLPVDDVLRVMRTGRPAERTEEPAPRPSSVTRAFTRMLRAVENHTGITPAAVKEGGTPKAAEARDAVVWAARACVELPYDVIGETVGGLDHEAVVDAYCRAIHRLENMDKQFAGLTRAIQGSLRR